MNIAKWLRLTKVQGLGPSKMMKLINYFGDSERLLDASEEDLFRSRVFTPAMIESWRKLQNISLDSFQKVIFECEQNNIVIVPLPDPRYPQELKRHSSPPLTLFMQGNLDLLRKARVAIVGSRESDEKATQWAYNVAQELVKQDIVVVSGGARGIDYAAHRGALDAGGLTICVFGTGLLHQYPPEHSGLFEEIQRKGLLVSEHFPSFTGGPIALLSRNRITSGLSTVLIQVTSGVIGGSATQMKVANEQRIKIFCPPRTFNFVPSEGIDARRQEFSIVELHDFKDLLDEINRSRLGNSRESLSSHG